MDIDFIEMYRKVLTVFLKALRYSAYIRQSVIKTGSWKIQGDAKVKFV